MRGQPILRIRDDRKTKERELKEKNEIKLGIRDQPYHAATYANMREMLWFQDWSL